MLNLLQFFHRYLFVHIEASKSLENCKGMFSARFQHLSHKEIAYMSHKETVLQKTQLHKTVLEADELLVETLSVPVSIRTKCIKMKKFCEANTLNYK